MIINSNHETLILMINTNHQNFFCVLLLLLKYKIEQFV